MEINTSEKSSSTFFVAVLVVLVFVIASVAAIGWMESHKVQTLENDTAWFESYFINSGLAELSEKQKNIIHSSVAIISDVAQDAGVTVTLQSVCGNGYNTYYKLDVELPAEIYPGQEFAYLQFGSSRLKLNDDSAVLGNTGCGSHSFGDNAPGDQHFSLLLDTRMGYVPGSDYSFDNGIIRTLHLEDLRLVPESGKIPEIKGQWDFELLFRDKGKVVEMVEEPVVVRGINYLEQKYYEAEIISFALTEFSADCQYKLMPNSQDDRASFSPAVIMKDGSTVRLNNRGGSGTGDSYNCWFDAKAPIPLDEVAFVKLTDEVVIPFSYNTN